VKNTGKDIPSVLRELQLEWKWGQLKRLKMGRAGRQDTRTAHSSIDVIANSAIRSSTKYGQRTG